MSRKYDQCLKSSVRRRRIEKTVHFANLMDLWHRMNAELARLLQKYKGRVVLREWHRSKTKQDTEQYSQCKVLQRLRWQRQGSWTFFQSFLVVGETGDANSAYTQVKITEAPRLLRLPKEECPEIRIRIPQWQRPECCDNIDDLVVLLERNLYDHPLVFLGKATLKKCFFSKRWGKVPAWECLYVQKKARIILIGSCGWDKNWLERSTTWTLCAKFCRRTPTLRIQLDYQIKCIQAARKERQRLIHK